MSSAAERLNCARRAGSADRYSANRGLACRERWFYRPDYMRRSSSYIQTPAVPWTLTNPLAKSNVSFYYASVRNVGQHRFWERTKAFSGAWVMIQSQLRLKLIGSFLGPDFATEGRSLILYGKPGRGKTHLAVAITLRDIHNGFDALIHLDGPSLRTKHLDAPEWLKSTGPNRTAFLEFTGQR